MTRNHLVILDFNIAAVAAILVVGTGPQRIQHIIVRPPILLLKYIKIAAEEFKLSCEIEFQDGYCGGHIN